MKLIVKAKSSWELQTKDYHILFSYKDPVCVLDLASKEIWHTDNERLTTVTKRHINQWLVDGDEVTIVEQAFLDELLDLDLE